MLFIKKTQFIPSGSEGKYIWAFVVITLLSFALIILTLLVRPNYDPVDVIIQISKMMVPTMAGVAAYLKSEETHIMINSRLDEFIKNSNLVARAEGAAQGVLGEQKRIAEQVLAAKTIELSVPIKVETPKV
jgi:hypothetical protein